MRLMNWTMFQFPSLCLTMFNVGLDETQSGELDFSEQELVQTHMGLQA